MPDNTTEPALTLMEKVAAKGPWAAAIARANAARNDLAPPEVYYDLLRPLCSHLDIWHTHYNHVIADHAAVVEWFKGSGGCGRSLRHLMQRCAKNLPPTT
jgi:trans-aconitate 2-methyltransferase